MKITLFSDSTFLLIKFMFTNCIDIYSETLAKNVSLIIIIIMIIIIIIIMEFV